MMATRYGRLPCGHRAGGLKPSARFAIFAVPALIAIAGCGEEWDAWRENNRRESAIRLAQEHVQREFDETYSRCIDRVVGAFSAGSLEVMKECERQACIAADRLNLRGEATQCADRGATP